MNTDMEDLLKDSLDRLTSETKAPAGLAARADEHHRRRRVGIGAVAASGTAALGAVAITVAAAGAGGGLQAQHTTPSASQVPAAHAQTAAYVVKRAEQAVDATNMIMETTSFPGKVMSLEGSGKHQKVFELGMVSWSYHNLSRARLTTLAVHGQVPGHLHSVMGSRAGRILPNGKQVVSNIVVNYLDKTWDKYTEQVPAGPSATSLTCSKRQFLSRPDAPMKTYLSNSPASFRAALACGGLKIAGHTTIHGAPAIELTATSRLTSYPLVVDVSPSTYLPLRMKFGKLAW
ncbi:MAG: hypothetical protein ABJB47_03680, partial [Actinomycetota bacterium]